MQLDLILFCDRNAGIDCSRTQNIGVILLNRFELRHAVLYNNPVIEIISLGNLASIHVGLNLSEYIGMRTFLNIHYLFHCKNMQRLMS